MFPSKKRVPKRQQNFVNNGEQFYGQNFVQGIRSFEPNDFVQILPACGSNEIMYGETLDFQPVSLRNGNIKYPIGKSFFAVNLPFFSATITNSDIRKSKVYMHTLFDKHFDHMLIKLNKIAKFKLHEILSFLTKKMVF